MGLLASLIPCFIKYSLVFLRLAQSLNNLELFWVIANLLRNSSSFIRIVVNAKKSWICFSSEISELWVNSNLRVRSFLLLR